MERRQRMVEEGGREGGEMRTGLEWEGRREWRHIQRMLEGKGEKTGG